MPTGTLIDQEITGTQISVPVTGTIVRAGTPSSVGLLLEDGDSLLLEDGNNILLEDS